jgi:hypothetical protein
MSVKCYKCLNLLDIKAETNLVRSESCPKCMADLRCCKMCFFYDPKCYNECKETIAERIVEKEKANFCDHFKTSSNVGAGNSKEDLLNLANSLFKKK